MEDFTLPEIPDSYIAIIVAIIAGFIAHINLKHSIKLQAKNKWKEDFRLHVSDYLESVMNFYFYSMEVKRNIQREEINKNFQEKQSLMASEVLGRFNRITLMIDYKDSDSLKLNEIFQAQHSKINDILSETPPPDFDFPKSIGNFFHYSKRIYDNKK
ncbi:hypothetical protein V6B16_01270 [Salinimicrobium catena]|uniref:hypothetical protein n=1 Tax=Salinimicrobium catena TaxID=390640 RepID=UPI002FE4C6A9